MPALGRIEWWSMNGLVVGVVVDVVERAMGGVEVPVGALITGLIAGIMVPVWAIWIFRRSPDLHWEPSDELPEAERGP